MDGQMVHVDTRQLTQTPDNRCRLQPQADTDTATDTKHQTPNKETNTKYRYKRDKKNSQNPLVRVPHLLIQPRLMHATGHRISSLHFRRVVESQVDIVNGLSAVGHGDATSQCRGQIPA